MDLLCQLKGILHFCQCQATLLAFFSSSGSFPGQSGMYSRALTIANHRWRNHSRPSAHHLQQLALNALQYVLPNANCLQLASYEKVALGPLRLGQPDCRTRSNVIVASFKSDILDRFQCENVRQSCRKLAKQTDAWHHVSMFHIHTYQYITYPYLFLPIPAYPDFFCCSFSVEHFWLETRQYRRKHSGNMPISLCCATGSSPLTPHGVASWSNLQQSSATLYTLFWHCFTSGSPKESFWK